MPRPSSLACVLVAACSAAAPTPDAPLAPQCGGEPAFDSAAPSLDPAESFVSVALSLPKEQLEKQLSAAVPWTLARASGRSAGAAGKVSYEVKRDPLHVDIRDGDLVVSTHLSADIDVCKPLGPVCLHYGKCRPEWQATVTVPPLSSLEDAPRPRLSLAITRGCVLSPVGYDATPELERITQEQARNVRGEIGRRVAEGHARMVEAVLRARRGLRFADDGCVSIEPLAVQQTPLVERDGAIEFALGARARVALECAPEQQPREPYEAAEEGLPVIETVPKVAERTRVLLVRDLPYEAIGQSLAREGVSVRLAGGVVAGRTRLLAGVSGLGRCEPEWVVVEPGIENDHIVLKPVAAEGLDSPGTRWLATHGTFALPADLARVGAQLGDLEQRVEREGERWLAGSEVRLWGPLDMQALTQPGARALRVGFQIEGTLSASDSCPQDDEGCDPSRGTEDK